MYAQPSGGLEHTRARRGGAGAAAQLRALRLLPAGLPHLPHHRQRARQSARPHLPDQADGRGRGGDRHHPHPPRPLPHLPRLRERLPVRRRVRAADRPRPRTRRGTRAAATDRSEPCGADSSRSCHGRGCSACCCARARRSVAGCPSRCSRAFQHGRLPAPVRRRRATHAAWCCSRAACSPASRPASTVPRRACSTGSASGASVWQASNVAVPWVTTSAMHSGRSSRRAATSRPAARRSTRAPRSS